MNKKHGIDNDLSKNCHLKLVYSVFSILWANYGGSPKAAGILLAQTILSVISVLKVVKHILWSDVQCFVELLWTVSDLLSFKCPQETSC